jgi:hypothetical protein
MYSGVVADNGKLSGENCAGSFEYPSVISVMISMVFDLATTKDTKSTKKGECCCVFFLGPLGGYA